MGIDQLVSLDPSSDAKEYILVRGDSFTSIENALIIADSDNTQITINGVPYVDPETNIDTLNAGEHFFVEGNYYSEVENFSICTLNPTIIYMCFKAQVKNILKLNKEDIIILPIKVCSLFLH
jgi:hypothetical protein